MTISDISSGAGRLYVVATPIGCLDDLTPRAADILKRAPIIAAEDTRTSWPLLSGLGVEGRLVSYHKFNERSRVDSLLAELAAGNDIALISDAGTPCVSDPGGILVRAAADAGFEVIAVCGACAAVSAASVSGFDLTSFAFYGFVPRECGETAKFFGQMLSDSVKTAVFYESPMRILSTISALCELAPDALLCVCNDLTKLHERIYRGTPAEVLGELQANPNFQKGEYTVVMQTPERTEKPADVPLPEALLLNFILKNSATVKDAVNALSADGPYSKKELYAAGVRLRGMLAE